MTTAPSSTPSLPVSSSQTTMLPEEPATEDGTENGSTKPRTVVVQQLQDVASEAEDGQDHEDGGDEPTQTDEDENDGTYSSILTVDNRLL